MKADPMLAWRSATEAISKASLIIILDQDPKLLVSSDPKRERVEERSLPEDAIFTTPHFTFRALNEAVASGGVVRRLCSDGAPGCGISGRECSQTVWTETVSFWRWSCRTP